MSRSWSDWFSRSCSPVILLSGLFVVAITITPTANAHDYYAKNFHVFHPWADPTEPSARDAAVYIKFDEITADDKLLSARTLLAERVELRGAAVAGTEGGQGDVLPHIALVAGQDIDMQPGTTRLVLKGLRLPLHWGRSYPMTLEFEQSGVLLVMVSVGTP